MRSLASIVMKEIENQIEDKVVPVISSIMGSSSNENNSSSNLETYEKNVGEQSPHFNDNREPINERNPNLRNHDLKIPYIQDEKGFI